MKKLILFVLVLSTSAFSQGPVLELRTETLDNNESITLGSDLRPQGAALDVNGDGVRDLIVSPRDAATGQATGFLVKSGNSNQTWVYPISGNLSLQEKMQNENRRFIGFYEMNNASPEKEAIFALREGRFFTDVVILNQEPFFNVELENVQITGIMDIDDDGVEELLLFNTQTKLLEIWGPGPKLELYPASFSFDNFTMMIDPIDPDTVIDLEYRTLVNGEKRNLKYTFLKDQSVDISILDANSNVLVSFNSSEDFWSLPEKDDEVIAWLVTQNLIKNTSVGLVPLWLDVKDSFSEESRSAVGSALGAIGGIIGAIPGIVDIFCRAGGTATCTDDYGTVTVTCDCGVPSCVTQQVAVTVRIRETDPSTGNVTEREEIQYKDKCVCTCLKLKETKS